MVQAKEITVCLACYRGMPWLTEQLGSLKKQNDPAFTVLMQDDGSPDDTVATLLDAMASDRRFRMARESGRHFGAAGNFLSLMRQSETPYVALCDQDDIWDEKRLSTCRAAMVQAEAQWGEETPILVHSDSRVLREDGSQLHASFFAHQGWNGQANTLNRLLVQNNVTGCTTLINRALVNLVCKHGNAKAMFMHDWFIAQTAAAFGHVVFVPKALVGYRQHESNTIGASKTNQLQRAVAALQMREKAKKRMQLNVEQAQVLLDSYPDQLPEEAKAIVTRFLEIQKEPKLQRVLHLVQGGYLMQSTVTQAGELVFG